MPNPLAITLHASAAETASATGPTIVDLGDRTFVELTVDATVFAGGTTPSIAFTVETSIAQSDWKLLGTLAAISAPATQQMKLVSASRYLRIKWVITGTPTGITFAATGTAHQLYCEPSDIWTHGIPKPAVSQLPLELLAEKCLSASDEASGYLASAYQLPMVSLDKAAVKHTACMATYELMRPRGYKADSGKDDQIRQGYDDALKWFNRIASGGLRPPGMVDSSPAVTESEVYVESAASRGWHFP